MNILVANDDGIHSEGLLALTEALSEHGDVYVAAPAEQRSGASQSITLNRSINIWPVDFHKAVEALAVDGTPTDCVKVGLQFWGDADIQFDLVFSGINKGSNLGCDTLYSGTVGAAMEGALSGVRSIAVSVDSHTAEDFGPACQAACLLAGSFSEAFGPDTVLNLNIPYIPGEQIRGIKVTRLGGRYYTDRFVPDGEGGYELCGQPESMEGKEQNLDMIAVSEGFVSITPISLDRTQVAQLAVMSGWDLKWD